MSMLIVERGANAGTRIPLTIFPVKIGRDPGNDIIVQDEECSRFHLRIKQRGRLIIAEDLDSRNGSYINGDRIVNSIVRNGDKILIGTTEFSFVTSDPNIQFATEIMHFDMVVAEELGIAGPIDVPLGKHPNQPFKPIRLNQHQLNSKTAMTNSDLKRIYEMHGNILVSGDLEEAAKAFLKHIGQIMPTAARAALFVWTDSHRQLIPVASKHYRRKQSFLLSQRAFEDVITRKQGIILHANSPQVTHSGRSRALIPVIQNDVPVCIVHIESDEANDPFPLDQIALIQGLFLRAGLGFDIPLGADLSGVGNFSVSKISLLAVLYSRVENEVSRNPRLLFNVGTEF